MSGKKISQNIKQRNKTNGANGAEPDYEPRMPMQFQGVYPQQPQPYMMPVPPQHQQYWQPPYPQQQPHYGAPFMPMPYMMQPWGVPPQFYHQSKQVPYRATPAATADSDDDDDTVEEQPKKPIKQTKPLLKELQVQKQQQPKKQPKKQAAAVIEESDSDDDEVMIDPDVVVVPLPKEAKEAKEANKQQQQKPKQQKEQRQEDQLIANFENVLNPVQLEEKPNGYYFLQCNDCSNVVVSLKPLSANPVFDKNVNPNERFKVIMLNGDVKEYKADDLNESTLYTQKYVVAHNNALRVNGGKGFIYVRTSNQNDVSIDTQREQCFNYAATNNIALAKFGFQYDEGISARNMNNLKYELGFWIEHIENGADIIIYSVDRLSRNLAKGIEFLNNMVTRNIRVHFVLEGVIFDSAINAAQRDLVYNSLKNAEALSNTTSEKVKNSKAKRRAEGHEDGPAKYGYKIDIIDGIRKKVEDQQVSAKIRIICDKYREVAANIGRYADEGVKNNVTSICRYVMKWCHQRNIKYKNEQSFTVSKIKLVVNRHVFNHE